MKCYSSNSMINDIFVNKSEIKETLSNMLFNSVKLFNCKITKWHFFLVFYYNNKDKFIKNIGYENLITCKNKDIQYILYNPIEKKFYMENNEEKNNELINFTLTNKSNLDISLYLNNSLNYMLFELEFRKNEKDNLHIDFFKGIKHFLNDLKIYKKNDDLMESLSEKLKVKELFYCGYFSSKFIKLPKANKVFLYKKKSNENFIGMIKGRMTPTRFIDLTDDKEIDNYNNLIDFEYPYVYILHFIGFDITGFNEEHKKNNDIFDKCSYSVFRLPKN